MGRDEAIPAQVEGTRASVVYPERLAHGCDHKKISRPAPSLLFQVATSIQSGLDESQARIESALAGPKPGAAEWGSPFTTNYNIPLTQDSQYTDGFSDQERHLSETSPSGDRECRSCPNA